RPYAAARARSDCPSEPIVASTAVGSSPQCGMPLAAVRHDAGAPRVTPAPVLGPAGGLNQLPAGLGTAVVAHQPAGAAASRPGGETPFGSPMGTAWMPKSACRRCGDLRPGTQHR